MFLKNLSVRAQVLIAPAIAIVLALALGGAATYSFRSLQQSIERAVSEQLPDYKAAADIDSRLRGLNALVLQSIGYEAMSYSPEVINEVDNQFEQSLTSMVRLLDQALANSLPASKSAFEDIKAEYLRYQKAAKETMEMKSTGAAIAAGFLSTSQKSFDSLLSKTDAFKTAKLAQIDSEVGKADQLAKLSIAINVSLTAALAAIGIMVSVLCARYITGRLGYLKTASAGLAQGNLSEPIELQGKDEIAALCSELEHTRMSLVKAVGEVLQSAESVRLATSEIATGNLDLSQRTEMQASSLEQTAASLQTLNDFIQANSKSVSTATEVAVESGSLATNSQKASDAVLTSMREIHVKSKAITEITTLIDSIAFKTNILALNAAVEAAKAGDQGRGFSVVASEVRSLALQCGTAAKQIRELIVSSAELVDSGVKQANQSTDATNNVAKRLDTVQVMLSEVKSATAHQASGIAEISSALSHIETTTQQNAALVEEAAAASQNLSTQAQRLVESVQFFRLPPATV